MAQQLLKRHSVYNNAVIKLKELEASGKAIVIRPSEPIEIGRIETNPERLQSVYDLGKKDASALIGKVKQFIKQ